MQKSVIVLGAKGRFGRAAVIAFEAAGWSVSALARTWDQTQDPSRVQHVTGDAFQKDSLYQACKGHDVIVNAVNLPYADWQTSLPRITENVIATALKVGADVMIPGNLYNYGNCLPPVLDENTPHVPNTKKGRLRIDMEAQYRSAATRGLRTIILRAGDFIEGKDTGNWFESHIAKKVRSGKLNYPGDRTLAHAWAYLPDMAETMVRLAERREELRGFAEFGYGGLTASGEEIAKTFSDLLSRPIGFGYFPWPVVRLLGILSPELREVIEMRYLWDRPHQVDDSRLRAFLGERDCLDLEAVLERTLAHNPAV